ncbi:nucleotidyltransferase [Acidaminobacter sp. JC074]|uniref:nucleotidyltransferase n=1 Tax=Acidaminobacter sp. JC074 TaxID=2530199 RepID=UPI001F0ECD42|nr:nucleotidyltransferase [Acidaminobacter sp. JC074]MCH4890273.1 nucleotidyltransferase [Acidaminobacter sp. JC074]
MKVVGLVTEYNPFHNGHLYHLNQSKEETQSDYAIAVMSGHFLQRGEPAIIDKWSRAKAAVESGVDLIIEIPTLYACSSAEYFAYGSVYLLNALGIVDHICFGSEDGNLETIDEITDMLLNPTEDFQEDLKKHLSDGHSFPKARSLALNKDFEFKANNILGIEYIKALKTIESNIQPATIKRVQADYLDENLKGTIASATAIRKHASNLDQIRAFVPQPTFDMMNHHHVYKEDLTTLLLYKIRTSSLEEIRDIHDVSEGLEYKIKKVAERVSSYEDLLSGIVSKRFTKTRVQRILVKLLLNIKKDDFIDNHPKYIRILAFNDKGKALLKKIKKTCTLPLITNINKIQLDQDAKDMLDLDITATNIYKLLTPDKIGGDDYLKKPLNIK